MKNIDKEALLSTVPVKQAIIKMGMPAILGMLITAMYNFVDALYVGMLNDTNALSATGIVFPIFMLIIAFGQLLAVGASTTIGRYLGAGNKQGASVTASTTIFMSFIVGIVFTITGLSLMENIFKSFGASADVLPYAIDYGKWMFIAALTEIPNQSMNSIARAESSAKTSAISLIIGAVTNIILDPIFIFTFNMGVEGAALATALAQVCSFLFISSYYWRRKSVVEIKFKNFKLSSNLIKNLFASGTPTFITQLLMSASIAITNVLIADLNRGDDIVAALSIVLKAVVIGNYIIIGFMQGYQPIAAYSFGAKNKSRFFDSFSFTFKICTIISIVVSILYFIFSKQIITLFNSDPFIVDVGSKIIISYVALMFLTTFIVLLTTLYQAIGMGKAGILVSSLRQGIIYIPIILVLIPNFGIWGLLLATPIADGISFVISFFLKNKLFKKLQLQFD